MTLNTNRRITASEAVAVTMAMTDEPVMTVEGILTLVLEVQRSHAESIKRSQFARQVARRRNNKCGLSKS